MCWFLSHNTDVVFFQSGQVAHSPVRAVFLHQLRAQHGRVGAHLHTARIPHLTPRDQIYQVNTCTHTANTHIRLIATLVCNL